jgi:hypothetical protein
MTVPLKNRGALFIDGKRVELSRSAIYGEEGLNAYTLKSIAFHGG